MFLHEDAHHRVALFGFSFFSHVHSNVKTPPTVICLFTGPGPEAASLSTGALEGSNVNPVEVLVSLMDYYRSFETQMKLVKSAEELDQTGTRLMQTS